MGEPMYCSGSWDRRAWLRVTHYNPSVYQGASHAGLPQRNGPCTRVIASREYACIAFLLTSLRPKKAPASRQQNTLRQQWTRPRPCPRHQPSSQSCLRRLRSAWPPVIGCFGSGAQALGNAQRVAGRAIWNAHVRNLKAVPCGTLISSPFRAAGRSVVARTRRRVRAATHARAHSARASARPPHQGLLSIAVPSHTRVAFLASNVWPVRRAKTWGFSPPAYASHRKPQRSTSHHAAGEVDKRVLGRRRGSRTTSPTPPKLLCASFSGGGGRTRQIWKLSSGCMSPGSRSNPPLASSTRSSCGRPPGSAPQRRRTAGPDW